MRAYFDIETGGLDHRKHQVWVASYATDQSDDAYTLTLFQRPDEGRFIQTIYDKLDMYDEVVTWNGIRFDIPFMARRAMSLGVQPMKPEVHIDLGIMTKNRYGLSKWTQESVMEHYGIPANPYPFDEAIWSTAEYGNELAREYIVKHCEHDVKALKSLYGHIMGYDDDI